MLIGQISHAQPGAEPPLPAPPIGDPSVPPEAQPPTQPEQPKPQPAAALPVPEKASVAAEMQSTFEEANDALLANNFARAITLFDELASTTRNSDLRSAAIAMADFARRLQASKAFITVGGGARGGIIASPDKEGGRTSFVITTTLAAFYSSFAVVDILGVDDFTPISLTVAATTAAGLGLSLYALRDTPMHPAVSSAYSTGLIAGVANGLLTAPVIGIDLDGEIGDGEINQNYLLFGLTTMTAGGAAGYMLAKRHQPTEAQVTTTSMAGLTGFASAGLLLAMTQPEDIEGETVALFLALGLDAGIAGGAFLSRDIDWSPSRANYVALSQFLGALGGFTAGALIVGEPDSGDEKVYAGLILGGIWAGLAGGIHLTKDMAPDASLHTTAANTVNLAPIIGDDLKGLALGGQF